MDTRQLRYFRTIAELGSFSRASIALRISQPALSRHMQTIEEHIGVPLLSRHSRGVRVTDAGRHLLERARTILRDLDNLREEVLAAGDTELVHLAIGMPPAVGANLLPLLLRQFQVRYPKATIEVSSAYSGHIRDLLNARAVDVVLIHNPEPQAGIVAIPLILEPLCLIGPGTGAGKLSGAPVSLANLVSRPLVMPRRPNRFRVRFDHEMMLCGVMPNIRIEVDGQSALQALVRHGLGYTVDTAGSAEDGVRLKQLSIAPIRPPIEMTLNITHWKSQVMSAPMTYLMGLIPVLCRQAIEKGTWPARLAPAPTK